MLTNPSTQAGCDIRSFFFSCNTKVIESVCPTTHSWRVNRFIPFPRILARWEMQTASPRIWTPVTISISYNDNHYNMKTLMCVCVCVCLYIYIHTHHKVRKKKKIWLQQSISFSFTHSSLFTLSSFVPLLPTTRQWKYVERGMLVHTQIYTHMYYLTDSTYTNMLTFNKAQTYAHTQIPPPHFSNKN